MWGVSERQEIFKCKKPCSGQWEIVDGLQGLLMQIDGGYTTVCGVTEYNGVWCRPVDGSDRWRFIPKPMKYVTMSGPSYMY